MSRARVDEIVNRSANGPVEFPQGLTVSADKVTKIGGQLQAYGNQIGTQGQVLKAGANGVAIWDSPALGTLGAEDGSQAGDFRVVLSTTGAADTFATFRAGTNVSLSRTGDVITVNSSFTDTNTVTRLQASGGSLVTGDVTIDATGASTVSQTGQTITIDSTNTTYTAGTGITLSGTEFSIPQEVATTSTPTFDALTITNGISAGSVSCTGNVTGTWAGGTIPINRGGTGNTTASTAFLALAPNITAAASKFLTTDGTSIYWDNLPASSGLTQLTYNLTAEEVVGQQNQAKLRITDSDSNFSEVVFTTSDDITISRTGNTITFGSTNANDTTLTQEEVEDIVGGMIDNSANTGITVTYNDATGNLEYTLSANQISDTNTTYDLGSTAITNGVGIQLTPGGSGAGDPVDQVNIIGGTNVNITRDAGTGAITVASTDTNTDTVTRLRIDGPQTTGGAYASGDISIQASGSVTMVQSGSVIAIGSTDTNDYVDGASWDAISGSLTLTRSGTLNDITLPVTNLRSYLDGIYATTSSLIDTRITGATWNPVDGNLTLSTNSTPPQTVTVNLDGRYPTDTGDNFFLTSGNWVAQATTPPAYHVGRLNLHLTRNDNQVIEIETESLYDYLDTLYAPITSVDTRVDSFTFNSGTLALSVSNGDNYSFNLDNRYVHRNDYIEDATFDTTNGVLTFTYGGTVIGPNGTLPNDLTVDLDNRYKLITAVDEKIASLTWNKNTGGIYATTNENASTPEINLDGRYFKGVSISGNRVSFQRGASSSDLYFDLPTMRNDMPDGTKILIYRASAPSGYVKETSNTFSNKALRVVNGTGGGSGGSVSFTDCFKSNISTGGSVAVGNLSVGGNASANFGSGNLGHNLNISGNPSGSLGSGSGVNISGSPSKGNLSVSGTNAGNGGYLKTHSHNYDRPNFNGRADSDDGTCSRGANNAASGNAFSGPNSHNHGLNGSPGKGNLSASLNANISVGRGSLGVSGNITDNRSITVTDNFSVSGAPSFTAGTINLAVRYIDVIVCRRDPSAP